VASLSLPDLVLDVHWSRAWTPWQALCARLLEDAIKCATKTDRRRRKATQRRKDREWLAGADAPLDFPTVCSLLRLEPTAVQRALRRRAR
jgi:hypothetical protein